MNGLRRWAMRLSSRISLWTRLPFTATPWRLKVWVMRR
jgi:hypothetical protein